MVGSAIESILSSINATVDAGVIPDRRGSDWIIYTMISSVPHNTKTGVSDYDQYRFQIDSYSTTYSAMDTLAASVKSALDNYSGTVESVVIDHVFFDGEFDAGPELAIDEGSTERLYRRIQDYIIFVRP